MGIIKEEEVLAFRTDTEVICPSCLKPSDNEGFRQENILRESDYEDSYVFCDRCGKMC